MAEAAFAVPALQYSELRLGEAYTKVSELAMRHPGYDVQDNMLAAWSLGLHTRGARWLTLLGPRLLAKAGGLAALTRALPAPAAVESLGRGALIRTGKLPEIGDVDRGKATPALRRLARVLEPITKFGEKDAIFTKLAEDDGPLTRWERRFLD